MPMDRRVNIQPDPLPQRIRLMLVLLVKEGDLGRSVSTVETDAMGGAQEILRTEILAARALPALVC
jgi:hypothetical protein